MVWKFLCGDGSLTRPSQLRTAAFFFDPELVTNCHPERSEGSVFAAYEIKADLRFDQDDSFKGGSYTRISLPFSIHT
jgi:hypothetical protein